MKADINVTPLIDVLLVLLIIFMVVLPVAPTALGASVPERTEGPPPPGQKSLVLEIGADLYTLNTAPIPTRRALGERLREAFEVRGDRTLFVRVEPGVAYDRVIQALDVAREAGAGRIGLVDETE